MEHSRIGSILIEDPGAPFHHIGFSIGPMPRRMGMEIDGRRSFASGQSHSVSVIEAGIGGKHWWDGTFDAACFYFTEESLTVALGDSEIKHQIRTTAAFHSPQVWQLLYTLWNDAALGQPHGKLVGDAVFVALAGLLVPTRIDWHGQARPGTPDWRVSRALEYIHTHLTSRLDIGSIAAAAGTSAFHLSRLFRQTLTISIWRYVLRERARYARALMPNRELTLTQIADCVGFETYPSFIAAMRSEFGRAPSSLR